MSFLQKGAVKTHLVSKHVGCPCKIKSFSLFCTIQSASDCFDGTIYKKGIDCKSFISGIFVASSLYQYYIFLSFRSINSNVSRQDTAGENIHFSCSVLFFSLNIYLLSYEFFVGEHIGKIQEITSTSAVPCLFPCLFS